MLPKKFRLPVENFENVYRTGKKVRGKYGMLVFSENNVDNPRIGFVVSKKIGNAVMRHRMTRLLRNSFLDSVNELNISEVSFDFQYVAFVYCDKYSLLKEEIKNQLIQIKND